MDDMPLGFQHVYAVELLCEEAPALDGETLTAAFQGQDLEIIPAQSELPEGVLAFAHLDHLIEVDGRELPPQTLLAVKDSPPAPEDLQPALRQSWRFREAEALIPRIRHRVLVSDLFASQLPHQTRLDLFRRALAAVLETVPCPAIHFIYSQQIVPTPAYLEASASGEWDWFFAGFLNTRVFQVEEHPGQVLMDTMGLAALGLPDLQCRFRGFDPLQVAQVLFNTGQYLFEHGDVIEDGHTVAGVLPESRWRAHREVALAPPERPVIDLEPGPAPPPLAV